LNDHHITSVSVQTHKQITSTYLLKGQRLTLAEIRNLEGEDKMLWAVGNGNERTDSTEAPEFGNITIGSDSMEIK
jgi:hypothetical protein